MKTQITSIHLFPGYSRQQVNYIYNQICVDMKFEEFYDLYLRILQKHKLIIDLVDMNIVIDWTTWLNYQSFDSIHQFSC